jgi:hypothetical protein
MPRRNPGGPMQSGSHPRSWITNPFRPSPPRQKEAPYTHRFEEKRPNAKSPQRTFVNSPKVRASTLTEPGRRHRDDVAAACKAQVLAPRPPEGYWRTSRWSPRGVRGGLGSGAATSSAARETMSPRTTSCASAPAARKTSRTRRKRAPPPHTSSTKGADDGGEAPRAGDGSPRLGKAGSLRRGRK